MYVILVHLSSSCHFANRKWTEDALQKYKIYPQPGLSKLADCYEHTRRRKLRTLNIVRKPFTYLKKKSGHQNFGKMEKKKNLTGVLPTNYTQKILLPGSRFNWIYQNVSKKLQLDSATFKAWEKKNEANNAGILLPTTARNIIFFLAQKE